MLVLEISSGYGEGNRQLSFIFTLWIYNYLFACLLTDATGSLNEMGYWIKKKLEIHEGLESGLGLQNR